MTAKDLNANSVSELLRLADEFDGLAAKGSTVEARRALEQLATRFRIFAARRAVLSRSEQYSVRAEMVAPRAGK